MRSIIRGRHKSKPSMTGRLFTGTVSVVRQMPLTTAPWLLSEGNIRNIGVLLLRLPGKCLLLRAKRYELLYFPTFVLRFDFCERAWLCGGKLERQLCRAISIFIGPANTGTRESICNLCAGQRRLILRRLWFTTAFTVAKNLLNQRVPSNRGGRIDLRHAKTLLRLSSNSAAVGNAFHSMSK